MLHLESDAWSRVKWIKEEMSVPPPTNIQYRSGMARSFTERKATTLYLVPFKHPNLQKLVVALHCKNIIII